MQPPVVKAAFMSVSAETLTNLLLLFAFFSSLLLHYWWARAQISQDEDNFCNHGCLSESNHGFIFIYNNETRGKGQVAATDYLDAAATVAQALYKVNIPFYNDGAPYQIVNDSGHKLLAQHMHLAQLL